jgi:hypothetical protein
MTFSNFIQDHHITKSDEVSDEGKDFGFSKLILATLYDSLGKGSDALKKAEKGTKLKLIGPMWFLQLWLNATFESNVNLFLPPMDEPRVSNRQMEGSRLALLRQRQTGLSTGELFTLYFKFFLSFNEIKEINTPFIEMQVGPTWFKQDFPATNLDDEEDINEIWLAFSSPTVLSSRLGAAEQENNIWVWLGTNQI